MKTNNPYEIKSYKCSSTTPIKKYKTTYYVEKTPYNCSCKYIPIQKVIYAKEENKNQQYIQQNPSIKYLSKTDSKLFPNRTFKYVTNSELGKKYCYGEKVDEKNNYTLYCSGLGNEIDEVEEFPRKKLFCNESASSIKKHKINYEVEGINEEDELYCADGNYRYKEVKCFKENYPEKKSTMTHKIYNTPLKFKQTGMKKNLGNKKIFGSTQKSKFLKNSYSANYLNKQKLNFVPKNNSIKNLKFNDNKQYDENKSFNEKKIYNEKTVMIPKIINKTKTTMSNNKYGNTTQQVKTYKKSTKDCDYLIKVTTTSTEIPIQDTDEGIIIKKNMVNNIDSYASRNNNLNVYDGNTRYHKNCLSDLNNSNQKYFRVVKSPKRIKVCSLKKKPKAIKEVFCPIHGKSTWVCTKIS